MRDQEDTKMASREIIVHVYDYLHPHKGGPPQVIAQLACAQRRRGCEVRLISIDAADAEVTRFIEEELGERPAMFTLKPRGIRPLISRQVIADALRDATSVHLHSIWPTPNLYVAHYCLKHSIPYVLSIHGHLRREALRIKSSKKRLGLLLGYQAMLNGASAIHALNASEAEDVRNFGLKSPIEVIPNGILPERFTQPPSREVIEEAIPALRGSPYLLFLSRIHPPKGARRLAAAFKSLSDDYPQLHLVIAGSDFGGIDEVISEIGEGNLKSRLHLPGFLSGEVKASALVHTDAFCLPSDHEGFSVAILEALAWGAPTVISSGCHFPEVGQAQAGWIHDLSVQDLEKTLRGVLSSREDRAETALRGREWVKAHFSWLALERRYQSFYSMGSQGQNARIGERKSS